MSKAAHYPDTRPPAPARVAAACVALIALLALGACGREDVRPSRGGRAVAPQRQWPVVTPADPAAANAVLMRALSLVGTPYRYGGNTPQGGFDCSGLVNYVYRDMLDLKLPRTSRELARVQGPKIAPERLAAADLVFFGSGGAVSHVGIYVGEGRFVHAPSTGGTVRLDHLDGAYWRDHYSGARRVLQ
ncbi:C40 family peptidase [Luteimonas sp. SX5]|uniref:C40 family peptidase n=1 Tax=Luteimonas galliterrae TaxID=2940486 RepID=A0ABT0MIW1_9GAMM|nr:C40 family peptidase [Luteimonas galliterrae]MCL1634189.1 C40 family peptidase [Luteimonas galliterrae]